MSCYSYRSNNLKFEINRKFTYMHINSCNIFLCQCLILHYTGSAKSGTDTEKSIYWVTACEVLTLISTVPNTWMAGNVFSASHPSELYSKYIHIIMYSLFTSRKPSSPSILNGERGLLGVNRLFSNTEAIGVHGKNIGTFFQFSAQGLIAWVKFYVPYHRGTSARWERNAHVMDME